ncbi:thiamine pyrophosphokinase [Mucilaginibacter sp.]|uniref:thiamine pyrophosphokinase n=1 Tax=Mucilaginibacter sp. TaxID=1882438 RepID=UPI002630CB60|nr:thiamine pyrophosphokinase [Mucilaginibacter sp.]MDB5029981.1 thiamine diphosphokinase [Mucilaginibacter sp.]
MSSHHIIREKQEPALLVLGLDSFDDEQLGQLLEWSPTLIVTPLIAEKLNSYGIKIDWVITDEIDEALQSDINLLPLGDHTIIASALNYLIAQGYPAVNIVADEFDLNDYLPFADKINLVIFYDQQKIYAVNPGFSKWKPAGEGIRLLQHPANIKTSGLQKISNDNFKTMADGFFELHFDNSCIFIAEAL